MNATARWTEKQGRQVIQQWRRSGRSMSAFARERGLNLQRLFYWRRRLDEQADGDKPERREQTFVPGVVVGIEAKATVSIRLPRGVIIETRGAREIEPRWVAELVQALEDEGVR